MAPPSINGLLLPLEPTLVWSGYFVGNLMVSAATTTALFALAWFNRRAMARPAFLIAGLLTALFQWPLCALSECFRLWLPNAVLFAASVHAPIIAALAWVAATPFLNPTAQPPSPSRDEGTRRLSNRTIAALFAAFAALVTIYLIYVGWPCTGLYAMLYDPEMALLAREMSMKLAGAPLPAYAYGILATVFAPVIGSVAVGEVRAALRERAYFRGACWVLAIFAALAAVMLPGIKGMLVPTFAVAACYCLLTSTRLRTGLLWVAATGAIGFVFILSFDVLKERSAHDSARSYDVCGCAARNGVQAEARALVESLTAREMSLGISRARVDALLKKMDEAERADASASPATTTKPATEVGAAGRTRGTANSVVGAPARHGSPAETGPAEKPIRQGPTALEVLTSRALVYVGPILNRIAVVPMQVASWHFLYAAEYGAPGVSGTAAARLFGVERQNLPMIVYQAYGSVYSGGDRTATSTAPTSFLLAYPAYLGGVGIGIAVVLVLIFDLITCLVLVGVPPHVRAIGLGLAFMSCVNFLSSDFGTVLLSHGGAFAIATAAFVGAQEDRRQPVAKRLLDVCGGTFLFLLTLPIMLVVAVAVRIALGSPVVFAQKRAGWRGTTLTLFKFRTMTNQCGPDGALLPDQQRLTAFGRWLRSTSLDELPSLWNVLKGDLSLVGPRPLLVDYLPLYSPEQARRHDVRPGLTGWAQVNGRNALSWEQKFSLDVWYVQHRTFWLDLKILWLTIDRVLRRRDISQVNHATAERFTGTRPSDPTSG